MFDHAQYFGVFAFGLAMFIGAVALIVASVGRRPRLAYRTVRTMTRRRRRSQG